MATFQRSTKKSSTGGYAYLDAKNSRILSPEDIDATAAAAILAKLAKYEELQESGRLHCFPCKPGDTVYVRAVFTSHGGATVVSAVDATVKRIVFTEDSKLVLVSAFADGTETELVQGEFYTTKEAAIAGSKTE